MHLTPAHEQGVESEAFQLNLTSLQCLTSDNRVVPSKLKPNTAKIGKPSNSNRKFKAVLIISREEEQRERERERAVAEAESTRRECKIRKA